MNTDSQKAIDAAVSAYLGDDLPAAVAAAEFFGDPVLSALVAAPVAKRKPEVEKWLSRRVMETINADGKLREGFELLDEKVKAAGLTGKLPLAELISAATLALRAAEEAAAAKRRGGLADLKARLVELHQDPAQAKTRPVPAVLVMLQNGSLKGFGNLRQGKEWARAQGQAWVSLNVDRMSARFHTDEVLEAPEIEDLDEAPEASGAEAEKVTLDDGGELLPV